MSRTNPYKKKRSVAESIILLYAEGLSEVLFLKYLKHLYSRNSGVSVKIRDGKGGSPLSLVIGASNEIGSFDNRIVITDGDRGEQEIMKAKEEARKRNVLLIVHSPCLEAIFLSILREGKSFSDKTCKWCKKEFESNYLKGKKIRSVDMYENIFPKSLLDKRRKNVPQLDVLISIMEKPFNKEQLKKFSFVFDC